MKISLSKIKFTLLQLLCYGAVIASLYLGVIKGIGGFYNLLLFYLSFFTFISPFLLFIEDAHVSYYEKIRRRYNLQPLSEILNSVVIGTLVFYGHVILAILFIFQVVVHAIVYESGKKEFSLRRGNE